MIAIEWRLTVEAAIGCIGRIVEPEAYLEGISRRQYASSNKSENLIHEYSANSNGRVTQFVRLYIGLVPGQAEITWCECRVRISIFEKGSVLDCEEIEGEVWFYVFDLDGQRVVELTLYYGDSRRGCLVSGGGETS